LVTYQKGLVRFVERRNLVSTRVPSHFNRSLHTTYIYQELTRATPLFYATLCTCFAPTTQVILLRREINI